jgi:hypothetical protein
LSIVERVTVALSSSYRCASSSGRLEAIRRSRLGSSSSRFTATPAASKSSSTSSALRPVPVGRDQIGQFLVGFDRPQVEVEDRAFKLGRERMDERRLAAARHAEQQDAEVVRKTEPVMLGPLRLELAHGLVELAAGTAAGEHAVELAERLGPGPVPPVARVDPDRHRVELAEVGPGLLHDLGGELVDELPAAEEGQDQMLLELGGLVALVDVAIHHDQPTLVEADVVAVAGRQPEVLGLVREGVRVPLRLGLVVEVAAELLVDHVLGDEPRDRLVVTHVAVEAKSDGQSPA